MIPFLSMAFTVITRLLPYIAVVGVAAFIQGFFHGKEIASYERKLEEAKLHETMAVQAVTQEQVDLCNKQKEITERAGHAYQDRISKLESNYNAAVKRLRERPAVQRCVPVLPAVHTGRTDAGADIGQHGQGGIDGESILLLGRDGQRNGETLAELQKFVCDVWAMNGKRCR